MNKLSIDAIAVVIFFFLFFLLFCFLEEEILFITSFAETGNLDCFTAMVKKKTCYGNLL